MDYSKNEGGHCPFSECPVDEKDADLAVLKALVREMGKIVTYIAISPNRWNHTEIWGVHEDAMLIFDRPEVRAILKEGSDVS